MTRSIRQKYEVDGVEWSVNIGILIMVCKHSGDVYQKYIKPV